MRARGGGAHQTGGGHCNAPRGGACIAHGGLCRTQAHIVSLAEQTGLTLVAASPPVPPPIAGWHPRAMFALQPRVTEHVAAVP